MIERGEQLGFAAEPREPFGIIGDLRRQHFERDVAMQSGVPRAVDLAHAAGAD
jgi:hypothetical protein